MRFGKLTLTFLTVSYCFVTESRAQLVSHWTFDGDLLDAEAIRDLQGAYIFADHRGRIWSLRHDNGQLTTLTEIQEELAPGGGLGIDRPTSFGEDLRGELYICDRIDSEVFKIVLACPWDLDRSGDVGVTDLLALLAAWGDPAAGPPDFTGDGIVGVTDLLELLANWGGC